MLHLLTTFLLRSIKISQKTMLSVLRKTKKLNLLIDMQLQKFDCMVVPCLLYGSEIYYVMRNLTLLSPYFYNSKR